jgi:predicted transcriptional regulator
MKLTTTIRNVYTALTELTALTARAQTAWSLAQFAGLKTNTVQRALDRLAARGVLTTTTERADSPTPYTVFSIRTDLPVRVQLSGALHVWFVELAIEVEAINRDDNQWEASQYFEAPIVLTKSSVSATPADLSKIAGIIGNQDDAIEQGQYLARRDRTWDEQERDIARQLDSLTLLCDRLHRAG